MKKILILGSNGFIGKSLSQLLNKDKYEIISKSRGDLDATNFNCLKSYLENTRPDFIIHAALSGEGRLLKQDTHKDFYDNLLMLENLLFLKHNYGKLITFSSGAGNDRTKDIENLKEKEIKEPPGENIYSFCKYLCNRRVEHLNNVINLRIFNVFGPLERDNRFIKSSLKKYINKEEKVEIWGDKLFDFFGINDVVKVVEYLIDNPVKMYYELNLCYYQKYYFSEIVNKFINTLDNYKLRVIGVEGINKAYWGSGYKLQDLELVGKIKLNGLEKEIKNMYEILKHEG